MIKIVGSWLQRAINSPLVLGLVIFLLSLGPRVIDLGVFVGPDEFYWLTGSTNFAQAIATGELTKTYHAGQPGVTLMWVETLGAWLEYGLQSLTGSADWNAIVSPDKTMEMLASKRLVVAVANAVLVALIAVITHRIFGHSIAWLTGFLLAFDPFLLTESRALRTEALATYFNTLALLSLLLYLQEQRPYQNVLAGASRILGNSDKPGGIRGGTPRTPQSVLKSWTDPVLAGVLTGLALLSKISALALLPLGVLVIGGVSLFGQSHFSIKRCRPAVLALLIWGGALLLTVVILWPALWVDPAGVFQKLYDFTYIRAVEGGGGANSFFLGEPYPGKDPGLLFYPVVLLYRTSPLLWAGLLLLALMIWPIAALSSQNKIYLGLMLLYLALYMILISRSFLKLDRYTIPMLPTLSIMAAIGLVTAWSWLTTRKPRIKQWAWSAALLILGLQISLALPYHPYYYTYWNPLLGGLKGAAQVLPVGVGNEGIDQVAAYLNTLPNAEHLTLASANSQKIKPIFKGQTIAMNNLDGEWVQADYVMIYISQLQRGKHAEDILAYLARHKPVYTLTLHGLEYAWLYSGPKAQYYGGGHKLEGRGALFGYDLDKSKLAAGQALPVKLYWRNEGQRESDRFFVRLMDFEGYVWAEAIAQPRPGFEQANRQENTIVESEANLTLPVGIPPGDYFFKPGFRTAGGEIIGYFNLPGNTKAIKVTTAKTYPSVETFRPPHSAHLLANDDLMLLGYNLEAVISSPDPALWVTLYWQALSDITHDYVILLRLLNQDQQEIAYWLGRPVRSGYPTQQWKAGQIVQDPWLLALPPDASLGDFRLEVAIFEADSQAEVGRQIIDQHVSIE